MCRAIRAPPCFHRRSRKAKRILTDAELRAVLRHAQAEIGPYGKIVELLILTGQRRGEIAALESDGLTKRNASSRCPRRSPRTSASMPSPMVPWSPP